MSGEKKKILGPFEIITFLLAIAIIAYIVFQQDGIDIMERTEQIEIVDNPGYASEKKKVRKYENPQSEENIEAVLRQIANEYTTKDVNPEAEKKLEKAGMSKGEVNYLRGLKERKTTMKEEESIDWLAVFNASRKTYAKVKSVFEKAGIEIEETEDKVVSGLINEVAAKTFYTKIEETFNISEAEARAFAQKGERTLSDWARFMEENKK